MFNLGPAEILFILVVGLLVLGPQRLPELAKGLGKFFREFRRQTDEVRGLVEREFYKLDAEPTRTRTRRELVKPAETAASELHPPPGAVSRTSLPPEPPWAAGETTRIEPGREGTDTEPMEPTPAQVGPSPLAARVSGPPPAHLNDDEGSEDTVIASRPRGFPEGPGGKGSGED